MLGGPFNQPPLPRLVLSPIGLVPKKILGEFRLINHLSYPAHKSVNDSIPESAATVAYTNVGAAIDVILQLGRGTSHGSCTSRSRGTSHGSCASRCRGTSHGSCAIRTRGTSHGSCAAAAEEPATEVAQAAAEEPATEVVQPQPRNQPRKLCKPHPRNQPRTSCRPLLEMTRLLRLRLLNQSTTVKKKGKLKAFL